MCVGALQARGIPAMPVGQPGHCAVIWAKPNTDGIWNWEFYNHFGGRKSYRPPSIKTPWVGADWMEKDGSDSPIWSVFAYDDCLKNIYGYVQSILDPPTGWPRIVAPINII